MSLNTILTIVQLALLLVPVVVSAYALVQFNRAKRFWTRISAHKEGEASEFGLIVDSVAGSFGRAVAMEAKTSLMGKSSALTRQENAIEDAVLKDTNPAIWGLLEAMPSVKKIVRKNPALLGMVGNMLAKKDGNSGNSNRGEQVKFKL